MSSDEDGEKLIQLTRPALLSVLSDQLAAVLQTAPVSPAGWLVAWLVAGLWLGDWLAGWLVGWLVGWLLVGWLVGWLIGWLVG